MSELNITSTLLDAFDIQEQLGESGGITTYHVKNKNSGKEYVLKHLSFPVSDREIEALRITGAIPTDEDAKQYYEKISEDYLSQLQLLDKLSEKIHFANFTEHRIEPKPNGIGFDLYLLSPMRETLEQFLDRTPMQHLTAADLAIDLCTALSSLREFGLIHCNIKPSNIYLDPQGHFMLGDLGLYRTVNLKYASVPERMIGTFSAPELFDVLSDPTETSDIYSVGLILYSIYNGGHNPFEDEMTSAKTALDRRIKGEELPAPIYADYELTSILLKACAFRPEDRFRTPEELRDAFTQYVERNNLQNTMIVPPIVTDEDTQVSEEALNEEIQPVQFTDASELDEEFVSHFSPDRSAPVREEAEIDAEEAPESNIEPAEDNAEDEENAEATEPDSDAQTEAPQSEDGTEEKPDIAVDDKEKPQEKKRRKFPVWATILCGIAALLLAAGVTLYLLTPQIHNVILKEVTTESIVLTLESNSTAADVTVYATDSYGNVIVGVPDGQDVIFSTLTPGTQYLFHLETLHGRPVRGASDYTATTLNTINVLSFHVKPISGSQIELSFQVAGGDSETWHIAYSDGMGENGEQTFTGHSVVLTDLLPDRVYTFTLSAENGVALSGKTQYTYTNADFVQIKTITAETSANEAEISWISEGNPDGSWTVILYDGGEALADQTVGEKLSEQTIDAENIVFTDLQEKHNYFLEVFCAGMKHTAMKAFRTNAVNLSNIKSEVSGNSVTLSWEAETPIPDGWQVYCTLDGLQESTQIIPADGTSATIDGLLPNCSYHLEIRGFGGEILGGTNETDVATPAAEIFEDYGLKATYMSFYEHPGKADWTYRDLTAPRSEYAADELVAFAVEAISPLKNSKDKIRIVYIVRDEDGRVVDHYAGSEIWDNLWVEDLYVGELKRPIEVSGSYSLEVYFNDLLLASQVFQIV